MSKGNIPDSPAELLDLIRDSRLAEDSETAISAFEAFATNKGDELAQSRELADAIVALAFMEEVPRMHTVLRSLVDNHTRQFASNPLFGTIINSLCRLNQEVEALEYVATCAQKESKALVDNQSLGTAFSGLHRKGADIEVDSLMEWLQNGSEPRSFPTFERFESIKLHRAEIGETHSPIQR